MDQFVQIDFDCLPLRSITRLDIPLDASPKYRARCERIKQAIERHGTFNTYYLYNAKCLFRLTNKPDWGSLEFHFEGTVMADPADQHTQDCQIEAELIRETCNWLTTPIVTWFHETIRQAVIVEFDRYIAAGDLAQTIKRIEQIQSQIDQSGGFVGMYL